MDHSRSPRRYHNAGGQVSYYPPLSDEARFVQRLADKTLQGITTACQFAQFGCRVEQDIASIGGHEEQCQYREVHCPAKHRGACQWFGALPKMVAHVREKGCIQVSQCMNRTESD